MENEPSKECEAHCARMTPSNQSKNYVLRGRDRTGATGAWHPQNFEILLNKTSPMLESY